MEQRGNNMLLNDELATNLCKFVRDSMILKYGMIQHQMDSFNKFLSVTLHDIIHENSCITIESDIAGQLHKITFNEVVIVKPSIREANGIHHKVYPYECRIRGLTYASQILVNMEQKIYDITTTKTNPPLIETRFYREICIGYVPVMLKSMFCHLYQFPYLVNECPLDEGGYFIVNGNKKVLITQEKLVNNFPCVFPMKQPNKYAYVCEVRSEHETKIRSTSTMKMYISHAKNGFPPKISCELPFVKGYIPLVAIFKIFHIDDPQQMIQYILQQPPDVTDPEIVPFVKEMFDCSYLDASREELCEWIGKTGTKETTKEKRLHYIEYNIFTNEFLPHIGIDQSPDTIHKKLLYFGQMVLKLCKVFLGKLKEDDRDHVGNKRFDCAGNLMASLFRPSFKDLQKQVQSFLKKAIESGKYASVADAVNHHSKKITSDFKYALSTGNWGVQKGSSPNTGVAQVHSFYTKASALCNLRKINTHINKEGKNPKPRQLHKSHRGFICIVDTPEGPPCGLLKNLTIGCRARPGYTSEFVIQIVKQHLTDLIIHQKNAKDFVTEKNVPFVYISVNRIPVGITFCAGKSWHILKELRRKQIIPFDCSIIATRQSIDIEIDGGALVRPVLVAKNIHLLSKLYSLYKNHPIDFWDECLSQGVVEFLSSWEETENCRVAQFPKDLLEQNDIVSSDDDPSLYYDYSCRKYTHVEILPTFMLGTSANQIPFCDFNQGPRNIYQVAMGKQTMAFYSLNQLDEMETITHYLAYPEQPTVQTSMEKATHLDKFPTGQNMLVAICIYTGYNQEDSIIMNQSAIDRGLFRSFTRRSFRDEEKIKGQDCRKFGKPKDDCKGKRKANYSKINDLGFVEVGTRVVSEDAITGKIMETEELVDEDNKDKTIVEGGARFATSSNGTSVVLTGGASSNNATNKAVATNHKRQKAMVKRDNCFIFKTNKYEHYYVDHVIETKNKDAAKLYRLSLTTMRIPRIGDKFSSRHGQKGTVGMTYSDENMPFLLDGRRVDAIINPHGIPSRMTIGKLFDMLGGTLASTTGKQVDGSPFNENTTIEEMTTALQNKNCPRSGKVVLMNGITGEPMQCLIFVGVCFYQRLKHVSIEKQHARSRGPMNYLTRQPTEGRSKDGGFRLGEMERSCMVNYGAASFLKERFLEQSDRYRTNICSRCGKLAEPAKPKNMTVQGMYVRASQPYCRNCRTTETVKEISMPYSCKLLIQELAGANVALRLHPTEVQELADTTKKEKTTRIIEQTHTNPLMGSVHIISDRSDRIVLT